MNETASVPIKDSTLSLDTSTPFNEPINSPDVYKRQAYHFPEEFYHSVHLDKIEAKELEPVVSTDQKQVQVRVIEVADGRTQTKEKLVSMEVDNNRSKWQDSGCMLAAVLARHGQHGNIGYGFVTGDCLKQGAVATTYYHDHHNLMVIGSNVDDMVTAARRLIELQGGICTVEHGHIPVSYTHLDVYKRQDMHLT